MTISILKRPLRSAVEKRFDEPQLGDAGGATGFAAQVKERLWGRMAGECEAMAEHALSTGRAIPVGVMERLDRAMSTPHGLGTVATPAGHGDSSLAETADRAAS